MRKYKWRRSSSSISTVQQAQARGAARLATTMSRFGEKTLASPASRSKVSGAGSPREIGKKGQYLKFVHADWPQPINVVHNHSVSSDKRGKLTSKMRSTIAQTGWDIVCRADSAAQPVAVFGGDYNCTPLEWYSVIRGMHGTKSMRRREQLCVSRLIEEGGLAQLHGDDALAINCVALHEASRYGNSFRARGVSNNGFSDNHDLVLVPILFDNISLTRSQAAVASPVRPLPESRKRCWQEKSRSTDASHWDSARAGLTSTSNSSGTAPLPTPPPQLPGFIELSPSPSLERVPRKEKALASGASRLEEEEEEALAGGAIWDPSVEVTREDL